MGKTIINEYRRVLLIGNFFQFNIKKKMIIYDPRHFDSRKNATSYIAVMNYLSLPGNSKKKKNPL